jgi:predicted RecB family nuclease
MLNRDILADPRLRAVGLPPQGGYFAGMCLKHVSNDFDPFYDPDLRDADDAFVEMLMSEGVQFETAVGEILEGLFSGDDEIVFVPSCDRTVESKRAREAATMAAMASGALFIWNARIPADDERISEPDWLERVGDGPKPNGKWAYIPGDVKHSKAIKGSSSGKLWITAPFSRDGFASATPTELGAGTTQVKHGLQLAHYHRHLASYGHHVESGEIWGAIYGKEGVRVYRNLAEPAYLHEDHATGVRRRMSALEIYDQEFSLRRLVAAAAVLRGVDPEAKPAVGPEVCGRRCTCPWRGVSAEELAEIDSVILLPRVTNEVGASLISAGVATVGSLARLDWRTASLMDAGIHVRHLMENAKASEPDVPALALLDGPVLGKQRPDAIAKAASSAVPVLTEFGVTSASDILALDERTASLSGVGVRGLASHIDQARVNKAGRVFRARGVDHVRLVDAAVQIDVDMENDDLIYLWGARLTVRSRGSVQTEYRPFVSWDGTDLGEAKAFAEFWSFLTAMRAWARASHTGGFKAYHYTAAEDRCMRHLVDKHAGVEGIPTKSELEDFLSSDDWVDMHTVLDKQTIWPTPDLSLKSVAKWIRFTWREENASGGLSVNWYRDAIHNPDESIREEARARVLEYNEDDVTATYALRQWLRRLGEARKPGLKLPSVSSLDVKFRRRRATPGITAWERERGRAVPVDSSALIGSGSSDLEHPSPASAEVALDA